MKKKKKKDCLGWKNDLKNSIRAEVIKKFSSK